MLVTVIFQIINLECFLNNIKWDWWYDRIMACVKLVYKSYYLCFLEDKANFAETIDEKWS